MADDSTSVREAGALIAQRGFTDEVRRGRTNRELARDGDSRDDADDRDDGNDRRDRRDRDEDRPRKRKDDDRRRDDEDERPRSKRREEPDEDADDDDRYDDQDDDEDDASNREDGEDDEDDDDRDEDDDADEDDDDNGHDRREKLVEVTVNGERFKVTQSELVRGYQRGKDYHQKTTQLAERGRTLQSGHQQMAEQYSKRLQALGSMMGALKKQLVGQQDGEAMARLQQENPAAWAVADRQFENRVKQVDRVFAYLHQEHERQQAEIGIEREKHNGVIRTQEMSKLAELVPDWFEGRKGRPSGAAKVAKFLEKSGFGHAEYKDIIDHRMLNVAWKAARYDELMERRDERGEPRRRPKPVPKRTPKGGSGQQRSSREDRQSSSAYAKSRDKLRKTGDMRDAGDAINALFDRDAKREKRRRRR